MIGVDVGPTSVVVLGQSRGASAIAFGALTLTGHGGVPLPAGTTSISNAGGTGLEVSGGFIVPAADGVTAGTLTFDNGLTKAVETIPDAYSVRPAQEGANPAGNTEDAYAQINEVWQDAVKAGQRILLRGADYGYAQVLRNGNDPWNANRTYIGFDGIDRSAWRSHDGTGFHDYDAVAFGDPQPQTAAPSLNPVIIEPHPGELPRVWTFMLGNVHNVLVRNLVGISKWMPNRPTGITSAVFGCIGNNGQAAGARAHNVWFDNCTILDDDGFVHPDTRLGCVQGFSVFPAVSAANYDPLEPDEDFPDCGVRNCRVLGHVNNNIKYGGSRFVAENNYFGGATDDRIEGRTSWQIDTSFRFNIIDSRYLRARAMKVEWIEWGSNGDVTIKAPDSMTARDLFGDHSKIWPVGSGGDDQYPEPSTYVEAIIGDGTGGTITNIGGPNDAVNGFWNLDESEFVSGGTQLLAAMGRAKLFRLQAWWDDTAKAFTFTAAREAAILTAFGADVFTETTLTTLADAQRIFRFQGHTLPAAGTLRITPSNDVYWVYTTAHADTAEMEGHAEATGNEWIGNTILFGQKIVEGPTPVGEPWPRASQGWTDTLIFGNVQVIPSGKTFNMQPKVDGIAAHNFSMIITDALAGRDATEPDQAMVIGDAVSPADAALRRFEKNIWYARDGDDAVIGDDLLLKSAYSLNPMNSATTEAWLRANVRMPWQTDEPFDNLLSPYRVAQPIPGSDLAAQHPDKGPWGADPALFDIVAKTHDSAAIRAAYRAKPLISIEATDPSAAEAGPTTGTFTVTRTMAVDSGEAIVVPYTVTGTAVAGTNYTALSGSVTLAADTATATITVTPIDANATADLTVIVTLDQPALTGDYVLGNASDTVTIAASGATAYSYPLIANATTAHFTDPAPITASRRFQFVGLALRGSSFNAKTLASFGASGPRLNVQSAQFNIGQLAGEGRLTGLAEPASDTTFDIVVNVDLDAATGSQITGWKREGGVTSTIDFATALTASDQNTAGTWSLLARFDSTQDWPMTRGGFVGMGTGAPLALEDVYLGGDPALGYRNPAFLSSRLRYAIWGPLADWNGGVNKGAEGGTMTVVDGASFTNI